MKILKLGFLLVTAAILTHCSSEPMFQITNLGAAKNAVQGYYESGEYNRECAKVIDDAISHINGIKLNDKSAVVFDIDETALSNYEHTKKIGFGYDQKLWNEWTKEGRAPAIKETKRFYDHLISKNIRVIFISGRYEEVRDATKRNLIEQGYTKFDTLIVRADNEQKMPAAEFKAAKREKLVKQGYDIIASIGDQWSDLVGGNAGYKIKLPNFIYLLD